MFDSITQAITSFLQHNNNPLGLGLLGLSAVIEYLFPPFPGDTVTLFGAFLITRYGWSLPLVFTVVTLGSGLGAMADFYIGIWLGRRYHEGRLVRRPLLARRIDRVIAAFQRHGEAYIALNRFLPAVRAVFFIAAGMARLRPARVLFFSLVSAAAWNALIIGAGYAVGARWEDIQRLFRTYSKVAWSALAVALVASLVLGILRRRRGPR